MKSKNIGENVVRIEAEALRALADRIGGPMAAAFQRAVDLLFCCAGRVVVTGMGKSGLIARKIAATLSSTGTPALYLHPVEALHGDLGMVVRGDVVLALSASGETEELLALLATIKRLQVPLIAMTGDAAGVARAPSPANAGSVKGSRGAGKSAAELSVERVQSRAKAKSESTGEGARATRTSTLAAAADVALDCSIAEEACSLGLAPPPMWRLIVRSRRRLARWGWRLRLPLLRCWHWATRWQSRSVKSADSKKKILPTCILAGSWESG